MSVERHHAGRLVLKHEASPLIGDYSFKWLRLACSLIQRLLLLAIHHSHGFLYLVVKSPDMLLPFLSIALLFKQRACTLFIVATRFD